MKAIIPAFKTPHSILADLDRRIKAVYSSPQDRARLDLLPNFSLLAQLLPQSACAGMDLAGLNHFGIHFPYDRADVRERSLNAFSSEGQLMRTVNIGCNTKYGPKIQVNTFVRLTAEVDSDPIWFELGVDSCIYTYIHADFIIRMRDQAMFDAWFSQYTARKKPVSEYDDMMSNEVIFVKCEEVDFPLPQYTITSRDGRYSWHFRTSDRNMSPLDWPAQIGAT